jgi:hypothetical protein
MKPFTDPWQSSMRGVGLMIAYTVACGVAFLLFGCVIRLWVDHAGLIADRYDQGVMGGLVNSPYFLQVFPSLANNAALLGTTVAIYEVGG